MGQRKSTAAKSGKNPIQMVDESEIMFQRSIPVNGESMLQTSTADTSSTKVEKAMTSDAGIQSIHLELVPDWVNVDQFIDILRDNVENFEKVIKFNACPALGHGENYMTLILRISIDVELKDKSKKNVSLIMKIAHDTEKMAQLMNTLKIFEQELAMYIDVMPRLEQVYREIGVNVSFAPIAYTFKKDPGHYNVLLEDLRTRGFKNANRLDGLNMEHTLAVLQKMAQFHAASAYWVASNGPFSETIMKSYYDNHNRKGFYEALMSSYKKGFLSSMHHFKDGEKYRHAAETAFTNIEFDSFVRLNEIDPNDFNVVNHGDCWVNNILFQYDTEGKILDTHFVDLQLSNWGSPTRDLYFFIISSVNNEIKLKHFDYFVRFYHYHLVENLKTLKYAKDIPTLRDFQVTMIKKGTWAFYSAVMILPIVLLNPTQTADLENLTANSKEGENFKNLMYSNTRYCTYIEELLPWLHNRGFMDAIQNSAIADGLVNATANNSITDSKLEEAKVDSTNIIPTWVNEDYFEGILRNTVKDFQAIKKFTVVPATTVGENYASVMLKVDIEMDIEQGGINTASYMLKTSHSAGHGKVVSNLFQLFKKEAFMYHEVIPQFEQIYKSAGADVTFAPRCFKFVKDPGCETILLENLRVAGFKNADRLVGLDMQHTKSVLQKLAQLHAASACYFETKGTFPDIYLSGIYVEENRAMMEAMLEKFNEIFIDCAKTYANNEEYLEKLQAFKLKYFAAMLFLNKIQPESFNVLNHGDCWTNNIMFQYDNEGKVVNTYFIDFQMPKYGSPAQDLYYFLLSSPELDIKLEHFDYCIRYYHENLKKNLELLKYTKKIPSLRELHTELLNYGAWGMVTVNGAMAAVLLEPNADANIESMVGDSEESTKFKMNMYSAKRYRSHAEPLLIWLNRRGLLDLDSNEQSSSKQVESATLPTIPSWVDAAHFTDILQESVAEFSKILSITSCPATKSGDNYASLMLRVTADIELKDGSSKKYSFMLKIPTSSAQFGQLMDIWNMFPREIAMYHEHLPEFERLYKAVGCELTFAPKFYKFKKNTDCATVLMQDLGSSGFQNGNRLEGLDMEHTKCVLQKLAQLHAASVKRIELNGPFGKDFSNHVYTEDTREMMAGLHNSSNTVFLECARDYENSKEYIDKLPGVLNRFCDELIAIHRANPNEFNVLNHGDAWLNNIMFQHDEAGKIKETFFVDFQLCFYGSPAIDLYYFLISSTQLDIKVEQFDYFIRYYYDQLVFHLTLLKCNQKAPSLREFQCTLLTYGILGFSSLRGVTGLCLLEPSKGLTLDSFGSDSEKAHELQKKIFGNDRYRAHASLVLTWLNRRGLLDILNQSRINGY